MEGCEARMHKAANSDSEDGESTENDEDDEENGEDEDEESSCRRNEWTSHEVDAKNDES